MLYFAVSLAIIFFWYDGWPLFIVLNAGGRDADSLVARPFHPEFGYRGLRGEAMLAGFYLPF